MKAIHQRINNLEQFNKKVNQTPDADYARPDITILKTDFFVEKKTSK